MKKIALITDGWGRYVTYTWIQGYRNYMAAHQSDMDLYIFQSFGNFSMDEKHNAGEYNIARLPDFSEFDGILLDLATVSQPDLIAEIIERAKLSNIPAISLLEQIPGLYHSGIDNYEAISRIVEHLITEHGCRTLNFIGGPEFNRENQLRFKAYRDALLRHGIPFEEQRVIHHNYEIETGIQAFSTFKEKNLLPDAFVCVNDNTAVGVCLAAKEAGIRTLFVPAENAAEATLARGPEVIPVSSIRQLAEHLNGERPIAPEPLWTPGGGAATGLDFQDVKGQENVKRALEIAAAGGHNVLLIGPPGSGKSMLSKRLPSILPDMTWEESLEVSKVYSVLGLLTRQEPLVQRRPFRSPHHTISSAGLAGGGSNPRPGEISMAHKGVLFLDELPEFKKDTLDMMRQPLEDGQVTISRVSGAVTYPSEFMLVCAMNPCKCGWYGDPSGRCICSQAAVEAYQSRISGPLLDRIDLIVEVPAVQYEDLRRKDPAEASETIRQRVNAARDRQHQRFQQATVQCNARMSPAQTQLFCTLDDGCARLMKAAFQSMGLTARSYDRILRVARTIADLDGSAEIQPQHLAEAIQYRTSNLGA